MYISNTYWCILCLLLLVPTSRLHLIHVILISLFTGLDMWWCWQQLCHTFMSIVTNRCEHIMQLPNNTSMFLGGEETVWWIGPAIKNVKIISNRCRTKSFYASKFVLLSEQNRYEQNPGTTGKLTNDYSVTDILHNQCAVQLREWNLWNLGHHILRHLRSQNTVQAGLVLSNLILHNFALTWLENLQHFSNLRDNFLFNVIWHNDPWLHLSSVGGQQKVTSLIRHQSRVWVD